MFLCVMPEEFTSEEAQFLTPFVTNLDKPIFVLKNLPEVVKGALFSRYSRSTKSLRRLLLDEFIKDPTTGFKELVGFQQQQGVDLTKATEKAQGFYDRVLDGYGDDSVGELGGAHIACEDVSNYAAKVLEDARIGGSPLEKSTRYVWFNQKVDGDYLFYREPVLMNSPLKDEYLMINRLLFDTYTQLSQPMTLFVQKHFPLDNFEFFDAETKQSLPFVKIIDEKLKKRATIAYNASVRAHACDVLRILLPASTRTNVGIFGNGRFFQSMLTKMYSHELAEIRALASAMHHELSYLIPSFVRRAKPDPFLQKKRDGLHMLAQQILNDEPTIANPVTLIAYDPGAETKVLAYMLYQHSTLPLEQLQKKMQQLSSAEQAKIIDAYCSDRKHRRDKLGRALENVQYTFDILADFGIYRDLQRHRVLTQERQDLTVKHGYLLPQEIVDAGFKQEVEYALKKAAEVYWKIHAAYPQEAQYVVPFAYKIRWYITLNLREAFHLIELRTTPQGHPSYRKICQMLFQKIKEVHPLLAQYMKFVDMNDYVLGRLASEMKKEEKKERLQ